MRYILTSLKLCSCNFKLHVRRCLGTFVSCNVRTKSTFQMDHSKNMKSLPALSLYVKRNTHVNVQQPQNICETTEQGNPEDPDFTSITNGDPVLEKKLKILFLEVEVLRQSGHRVPQNIKLRQWEELLALETRTGRRKYLSYIFGVEKARENRKNKKTEHKIQREEKMKKLPENNHLIYALGYNTIFQRVYDSTVNNFYNNKLMQAMQFGQKLVLDCSYDSHMTLREAMNCGKQLTYLFSDNRAHDSPFDLHLCNAIRESNTMKQFVKFIPTLYDPDFPINITEKHYLELFPKENIVYLTPHCREEMREFDHDAVYIIGAMVDKVNAEPLSLAKAKREGLKMEKLPLDRYLLWGSGGSKSLTLNQVIKILLDIRATGSWDKALQHVPRRKLATAEDIQERSLQEMDKSKQKLQYIFKDRSKQY